MFDLQTVSQLPHLPIGLQAISAIHIVDDTSELLMVVITDKMLAAAYTVCFLFSKLNCDGHMMLVEWQSSHCFSSA